MYRDEGEKLKEGLDRQERRSEAHIVAGILIFIVVMLLALWFTSKARAQEGSESNPHVEAFDSFPVKARCPTGEEACASGEWYVGLLFSEPDVDRMIEDAADLRKCQDLLEVEMSENERINRAVQGLLEAEDQEFQATRLELQRAKDLQPVLVGGGLAAGVAGTLLIVFLANSAGGS